MATGERTGSDSPRTLARGGELLLLAIPIAVSLAAQSLFVDLPTDGEEISSMMSRWSMLWTGDTELARNPPLLRYLVVGLASHDPVGVGRLVSHLGALACVALTFGAGRALRVGPVAPLLASLLVALDGEMVGMSGRFRSYTVGAALVAGYAWGMLDLLGRRDEARGWALVGVCGLLLPQVHYLLVVVLVALALTVALLARRPSVLAPVALSLAALAPVAWLAMHAPPRHGLPPQMGTLWDVAFSSFRKAEVVIVIVLVTPLVLWAQARRSGDADARASMDRLLVPALGTLALAFGIALAMAFSPPARPPASAFVTPLFALVLGGVVGLAVQSAGRVHAGAALVVAALALVTLVRRPYLSVLDTHSVLAWDGVSRRAGTLLDARARSGGDAPPLVIYPAYDATIVFQMLDPSLANVGPCEQGDGLCVRDPRGRLVRDQLPPRGEIELAQLESREPPPAAEACTPMKRARGPATWRCDAERLASPHLALPHHRSVGVR